MGGEVSCELVFLVFFTGYTVTAIDAMSFGLFLGIETYRVYTECVRRVEALITKFMTFYISVPIRMMVLGSSM